MPFEHEHKYVLKDAEQLYQKLSFDRIGELLHQFYISDNARFRRIARGGVDRFYFTFKVQIAERLMEFEQEISRLDFDHAYQAQVGELRKLRFKVPAAERGAVWDIDLLLHPVSGHVYFALAEIEHNPGSSYEIPEFLEDHILLAVPEKDSHLFSNRLLENVEYATTIVDRYLADNSRG